MAQWVKVMKRVLRKEAAQGVKVMEGQQGRYKLLGGVTSGGTVGTSE